MTKKVKRGIIKRRKKLPHERNPKGNPKIIGSQRWPKDDEFNLTQGQIMFVNYYFADPVKGIKAAAIKAGYAKGSAHVHAGQLMKIPEVRRYLKYLTERMRCDLVASVKERRILLTEQMRGTVLDGFKVSASGNSLVLKSDSALRTHKRIFKKVKVTETPGQFGNITNTELEVYDSQKAMEMLNKMDKLYMDRAAPADVYITISSNDKDL